MELNVKKTSSQALLSCGNGGGLNIHFKRSSHKRNVENLSEEKAVLLTIHRKVSLTEVAFLQKPLCLTVDLDE